MGERLDVGLAAVAVNAVAFFWTLARMDILTIRGVGLSAELPLPDTRPRHQVHPIIPSHTGGRWGQAGSITSTQPQLERLRRAVGALGQRGVFVQADSVR